jgi:hypothetical protein
MAQEVRFTLSFDGHQATDHLIDFYDAADALTGFQRSLALTTHLVLNGEIIVQAPSLKGAKIYLKAPEDGSWKTTAIVVASIATGIYHIGTASRDTVIGSMIVSAYDYVISESLGFHVDFDKTLGQQYEELQENRRKKAPIPKPTQSQMDALIEKCEANVRDMHRPIVASKTALTGGISFQYRRERGLLKPFSPETFDYLLYTELDDKPLLLLGKVSSYNMNTYKGRIYLEEEHRPVPFLLHDAARTNEQVALITKSLDSNAIRRLDGTAEVKVVAFRHRSVSGRLKGLVVTDVIPA